MGRVSVVGRVRDRILGGPEDGIRIGNDRIEPIPLSQSVIHELFSSDRRRLVVNYLVRDADGRCTLSDLAEYIAAIENGCDVEELSSDQRKRVYIGLYQCHLPKMDDAGVIEWDKDRTVVRATALATPLSKIDHNVSRITSGVPA